jgi:hypothetical protein
MQHDASEWAIGSGPSRTSGSARTWARAPSWLADVRIALAGDDLLNDWRRQRQQLEALLPRIMR